MAARPSSARQLENFKSKAPHYMRRYMEDLDCTAIGAAAAMGNAGHESAGLLILQEMKPTVKGSKGGFGWYQWTGMSKSGRRRQYMDWCKANDLDPADDDANYGFSVHELKTTERRAVSTIKNATNLRTATIAFCDTYERPGVKHYDSRVKWAVRALSAYKDSEAEGAEEEIEKAEVDDRPKSLAKSKIAIAGAAGGTLGATEIISQVNDASSHVVTFKSNIDDLGLWDQIARVASSPRFWIYLAITVLCGLMVYWRWRDYGRGQR